MKTNNVIYSGQKIHTLRLGIFASACFLLFLKNTYTLSSVLSGISSFKFNSLWARHNLLRSNLCLNGLSQNCIEVIKKHKAISFQGHIWISAKLLECQSPPTRMGKNVDLNPLNKVSALENKPPLKCYYSMHVGPSHRPNSTHTRGLYAIWRLKKIILDTDCLVLILWFLQRSLLGC